MTIGCVAVGNPVPYLAWLSPDGTVLQNRTSPSDTNLTLPTATRLVVGVYTCVASNPYGTDRKQSIILGELFYKLSKNRSYSSGFLYLYLFDILQTRVFCLIEITKYCL